MALHEEERNAAVREAEEARKRDREMLEEVYSLVVNAKENITYELRVQSSVDGLGKNRPADLVRLKLFYSIRRRAGC